MRKTILNRQRTYSSKLLKLISIFTISTITLAFQLFLSGHLVLAVPSASIGANTASSVTQSIIPTESGTLGTNQPATVYYSTTCKNTGGLATIYISASSSDYLPLTGVKGGTAENSTIPTSKVTTGSGSTLDKDYWGYTLSDDTSSYLGLTTSPAQIATLKPTSAGTASGNTTIYYNANVSTAKPSGIYSTTVTYTAVLDTKCNQYTISYRGDGYESGSVPGSVTYTWSDSAKRTIASAGTMARPGYTFKGWARSVGTANAGTVELNAGVDYLDDEINPNNATTVQLYPVWERTNHTVTIKNGNTSAFSSVSVNSISNDSTATITTAHYGEPIVIGYIAKAGYRFDYFNYPDPIQIVEIAKGGTFMMPDRDVTITINGTKAYMQDIGTTAACQRDLVAGESMTVYDRRDENTYLIGKLADNRCWMLQNLRLGGSSPINLSSSDTNLASGYTYTLPANITNKSGWTNSYTSSEIHISDANESGGWNGAAYSQITKYNGSTTSATWSTTGVTTDIVGAYYNYHAATAGTISGYDNTTKAQYDICPKGWHLPSTGSSTSDFGALITAYGGNTSRVDSTTDAYKKFNYAFRTVLSGQYDTDGLSSTGSNAYYWSSTVYSEEERDGPFIGQSSMFFADNDFNRAYGNSIRCVAYAVMQEMTTIENCLKLTEGQTMVTIDKRDGREYTIGKLADGKCWMLQNLRLGGSSPINLSSSDTNLAGGYTYTLPANITNKSGWTNSYTSSEIHISDANESGGWNGAAYSQITKYNGSTTSVTWSTAGVTTDIVGGYYNYHAATAGTISGYDNTTKAQYDICPKGWHLPSTGSSTSDFGALITAYGGNTSRVDSTTDAYKKFNYAFRTVLSGQYDTDGLSSTGSNAYYWSSTVYSEEERDGPLIGQSIMFLADNDFNRAYGNSIRCVAYAAYMQDVTAFDLETRMPDNGDGTILYDKRDQSSYQITRINNKYNMTQNLRIMGTVTSDLSNFTSGSFNIEAGGPLTLGGTYTEPRALYSGSEVYGSHYNYCAASAGTLCDNTTSMTTTQDICPKGWKIPVGFGIYKEEDLKMFDVVFGGYYNGTSLRSSGRTGYWWNTYPNENNDQWYLEVWVSNSGGLDSSDINGSNRDNGLNIRCVFGS